MRILIIRLSAIGDVVFASPLIHVLRQHYPEAHLTWLVQPESADLLVDNEELDDILLWSKKQWSELAKNRRYIKLFLEMVAFRKKLKQEKFDLVLDLQGLLKSGLLAWFTGASRRVGLGSREGSQFLVTETIPRGDESRLIGAEYRYLARHLSLDDSTFDMKVSFSDTAARKVKKLLPTDTDYAVICPFTTRPQKHWFNSSWEQLVETIRKDMGLTVVMLGGPADKAEAAAIEKNCSLVNLVGKTGLQDAAAVISGCKLQVGVDTGLTHMGIAFDRPTVCLFGSTAPYLETGKTNSCVIYHQRDCSPCRRNPTCHGRFDCMRDIKVSEVLETAFFMMSQKPAITETQAPEIT